MDFPRGGTIEGSEKFSARFATSSLFSQKRSAPAVVIKAEKRPKLGLVLDPNLDSELVGEITCALTVIDIGDSMIC